MGKGHCQGCGLIRLSEESLTVIPYFTKKLHRVLSVQESSSARIKILLSSQDAMCRMRNWQFHRNLCAVNRPSHLFLTVIPNYMDKNV